MSGEQPKLLKRPERRRALVAAATRAFAKDGFAATSLEDVAAEAGVSKVLIYRHFDTKAELYQAALDEVAKQLVQATGAPDKLSPNSLAGLAKVARDNPDGFRLFFRHSGREPEFREHADWLRAAMAKTAEPYLRQVVKDEARLRWASAVVPAVVIETLLAWLDSGAPDPDAVPATLADVVSNVINAMAKEDT
ncbi:MAG TPA: TetR/AcrR family transcriptional regulator [Jiangellaceae bacterium]|nr:TetR/AcrR family transcriptional regulator [Jiangellaceae bacterium]